MTPIFTYCFYDKTIIQPNNFLQQINFIMQIVQQRKSEFQLRIYNFAVTLMFSIAFRLSLHMQSIFFLSHIYVNHSDRQNKYFSNGLEWQIVIFLPRYSLVLECDSSGVKNSYTVVKTTVFAIRPIHNH